MSTNLPRLEIKKTGQITDINGKKVKFKVGKYVTLPQSGYPQKRFVIQEILFENRKEIRIGYYVIGKNPQ